MSTSVNILYFSLYKMDPQVMVESEVKLQNNGPKGHRRPPPYQRLYEPRSSQCTDCAMSQSPLKETSKI